MTDRPAAELPELDRDELVRRAASLAWYKHRPHGLTPGDHNALERYVGQLAEQLGEPVQSIRDDLERCARTWSTQDAQRELASLLLGA